MVRNWEPTKTAPCSSSRMSRGTAPAQRLLQRPLDIDVIGTGTVSINAPAAQSPTTVGNLKIGDGQKLGANKNSALFILPNVTRNGASATFAPATVGHRCHRHGNG